MARLEQEYIEISLTLLRRFASSLKFDIYVRRTSQDYTKIFLAGDIVDWQRVKLYTDKGIKYFYCKKEDYDEYGIYVEQVGHELNQKEANFTQGEALEYMKEIVQYTMHEFAVKLNADQGTIEAAANMVSSCIDSLNKDPKTLVRLLSLLSHQPYLIKHSVAVSMFSVMLAKKAGIENDSNLKIIGLGGLLHDIGEGQLDFDPEDVEILTPEQRRLVWRHPELGKQLLDGLKNIRSEVLQIVMQHHEQPNGHGYPNGLRGGEIYYPAKVVAIADSFASMVTKRSYREAFSIERAIICLKENQGKYDRVLIGYLGELFLKKTAA